MVAGWLVLLPHASRQSSLLLNFFLKMSFLSLLLHCFYSILEVNVSIRHPYILCKWHVCLKIKLREGTEKNQNAHVATAQ